MNVHVENDELAGMTVVQQNRQPGENLTGAGVAGRETVVKRWKLAAGCSCCHGRAT